MTSAAALPIAGRRFVHVRRPAEKRTLHPNDADSSIADLIPAAPGDRLHWEDFRTGPAGELRLHRC